MQMRKMFQTTNKQLRAAQLRKDARECQAAGFPFLAWVNDTEASILDPIRTYEDTY